MLVATDGSIAAFGHDRRRLRPNLVIGGVEGMAERDWPGACLQIGPVLIGVQDLRLRCIMTSYDPDTLAQDKAITEASTSASTANSRSIASSLKVGRLRWVIRWS